MRHAILFLFLTVVLSAIALKTEAQCKSFARRICKVELDGFIHDGNYHAAILTEGEEAELYKTFYGGQDYRIAICGYDSLPDIEFKVMDLDRNVLYNNEDNEFNNIWDFRAESSQQLMISVKVLQRNPGEEPESGCVAILVGLADR